MAEVPKDRMWRALVAFAGIALVALIPYRGSFAADPGDPIGGNELDSYVASGKLDKGVADTLKAEGRVDAIVLFDGALGLQRAENRRRAEDLEPGDPRVINEAAAAYGDAKRDAIPAGAAETTVLQDYTYLPTQFVNFKSEAALVRVLRRPLVTGVRENRAFEPQLGESLPLINQPAAQNAGYTGAGTSVAVLDTGLDYTRPAFGCTGVNTPAATCRVPFVQDFATDDNQLDDNGHGTNVAGIVLGVAPQAKVLGLDVFGPGGGYPNDIIDAINWVIQNKAAYNIVAANMSLGDNDNNSTQCSSNQFVAPFASLRAAGVLPVVAAGNHAHNGSSSVVDGLASPGCTPGAVSVGAVYDSAFGNTPNFSNCPSEPTAADQITCFSQTASYLSVLAPGGAIAAAGITNYGTSQATPHVAGAIAVVASAAPGSSLAQRQAAVTGTGPLITDTRAGVPDGRSTRRLDVCAALAAPGILRPCGSGTNNDNIANATVIASAPSLLYASTKGYTTAAGDPALACAGNITGTNSTWYKLTTGTAGTLSLNTGNSGNNSGASGVSTYDTVLAVFGGAPGSLSALACDDNTWGSKLSQLSVALSAGTAYYIEVADRGTSLGGHLVLNVSYTGTIVLAPPATQLAFTSAPGAGTVGVAFGTQPVVAVRAADNSTVTTDNSTVVTLAINSGPAGGVLTCSGGLSKTAVAGVASFSGCAANVAGTYTLKATATGLTQATTGSFVVSAAPATKLGFTAAPSSGSVGSAFPTQPTVAVQTAAGATVTTDNATVVTLAVASGPGALTCTGGLAKTVAAGVASFSGCAVNVPGTYTLRATATALTQATTASFAIAGAPGSPPAKPTYVTATTDTASATITWGDVSGETGYNVIRQTPSGWQQVGSVGADITTFTETGLAPGTYYAYWVIAFNASGANYAPTYVTAITATTLPAAPSTTSATALSNTQVRLTWTDNANNEDGFQVKRYISGAWTTVGTVGPNVTTYTDSGLTTGVAYAYWITSYNSAGLSYSAGYISAVAKGPSANQPSYGDPTVTSTAVTLTWSNNGTGATGWRMLKNTPQGWVEIGSPMAADVFSVEDTGLTPGAYYAYWLIKDTAGGAVYAATYITIIPPALVPAKPAFASAWGGSGQATLTWQDNSSNEDGFRVLRYVGGSWVDVSGALAPGTTTFTDTGLAPGQYAYWITAYNASGTSYGPALISASVY